MNSISKMKHITFLKSTVHAITKGFDLCTVTLTHIISNKTVILNLKSLEDFSLASYINLPSFDLEFPKFFSFIQVITHLNIMYYALLNHLRNPKMVIIQYCCQFHFLFSISQFVAFDHDHDNYGTKKGMILYLVINQNHMKFLHNW